MSDFENEISIVVTIFNFEKGIDELCEELDKALGKIEGKAEVILIDDCSTDGSFKKIKECASKYAFIKGVKLLRNFGQHAAISAGLQLSSGRYTVIMDGDLQDDPALIIELYKKISDADCDIVYVRRKSRSEGFIKKVTSTLFYNVLSKFSGIRFDPEIGTYRIMTRFVVESFRSFSESNKFIGGLFNWLELDAEYIDAQQLPRKYGKSGYSFKKLFRLAERGIIGHSFKPLDFSIYLGLISALFSFLIGIYYIISKLTNNIPIPGYTSIIVSVFFVGGLILFVLGIFGKYLAQILMQVRRRPEFIIHKRTPNWDESKGD